MSRARRSEAAAAEVQAAAEREAEVIRPLPVADPVDALAAWSQSCLIVPPGHPMAGQPMTLPEFGREFLRDALRHRESALCMARKNAKSAICAVLVLGYLVGPLATAGWRGAVASVNKAKAAELKRQIEEIAAASELEGLVFRRSPAPGMIEADGRTLEVLSADASSGHASGFDLVLIDETGLLTERDRALVNGLRSSTSARDGRVLHLSIAGSGPFIPELIEARDDPAICVHHYAAPEGADLQDRAGWEAANPGLGSIKAVAYMQDRARLAAARPADAADFRAHDLNLPGEPSREMICTPADWAALVVPEGAEGPPRRGPVVVGLDAGGSASMTAAAAIWPATGRAEVWAAFPAAPPLLERGRHDGVGGRYARLHAAGELLVYPGRRSTPVVEFLQAVADDLQGCRVVSLGADRFRQAEVGDALSDARIAWPVVWRGQGAGATADGSADVRACQRMILDQSCSLVRGRGLMVHAIAESAIRRDPLGNPGLEKGRQRGRIDPLSAFVIAAGLTERRRARMRAPGARVAHHVIG